LDFSPERNLRMQFVLLIYQGNAPLPNTPEWSALSHEEQKAIYADYAAINETKGVTPGLPFGLPEQAKTVRVQAGTTAIADGPYAGNDAAAAGYLILEAEDIDAATAIAARIPAARHGGGIEIRPVSRYW
jgi:hypothetical protein